MSLNEIKFTPTREEKEFKDKGKLIISKELQLQISQLHYLVKPSVEWSGPLVYSVISGDINDPSSLVIKAEKLILMDIGTSAYTEYEYKADDEYMMEEMAKVYDEGKKLGQIHTHHNMPTFFSGTDSKELHDNAPNYNFYLSLIVNYKDGGDWCAKIAACGTEKITGKATTVRNWKTHSGQKNERFKEEINEEVNVLYLIKMDIEFEVDIDFANRLTEIKNKPKYTPYQHHGSYGNHKKNKKNKYKHDATDWNHLNQSSEIHSRHSKEVEGDFPKALCGIEINNIKDINEALIRVLFSKVLSLNIMYYGTFNDVIYKTMYWEDTELNSNLEQIEEKLENFVKIFFGVKPTPEIMERVAMLALNVLRPYRNMSIYKKLIQILDVYIPKNPEEKDNILDDNGQSKLLMS